MLWLLPVVTRCHPLYLAVTLCHPLPLVIILYHMLSPVTTRCHPLSPVVTRCHPSSPVVTHRHPSSPVVACRHSLPPTPSPTPCSPIPWKLADRRKINIFISGVLFTKETYLRRILSDFFHLSTKTFPGRISTYI